MSPLPRQLVNRWQHREELPLEQGLIYWHILLGNDLQVRKIAEEAQMRLAGFPGLHMTPLQWLHITIMVAGSTQDIAYDEMQEMLNKAAASLYETQPVKISLERVLYHPEAIALEVQPSAAMSPILEAAQSATGENGSRGTDYSTWTPHVTVCYSTDQQAAEPIISTLGKNLPGCGVTIKALDLVIQRGPERLWDWHSVGTVHLLGDRKRQL
jgi:2'-5' RNA ligase